MLNNVLFAKLDVHQFALHASLPSLMFAKCTVCTVVYSDCRIRIYLALHSVFQLSSYPLESVDPQYDKIMLTCLTQTLEIGVSLIRKLQIIHLFTVMDELLVV